MTHRRSRAALAAACLVAAGGHARSAHAQSAHTPGPVRANGLNDEGVVVRAAPPTKPPRVISTYPAQGATVAPGTLVLKVVFDQRMTPDGWSYAKGAADLPSCLPRPRLLDDARTFVLLCATVAGRPYAVGLNAEPVEGFANAQRKFAPRYDLRFATAADGEPVRPIAEAVRAAGLRPQDDPIVTWRGVADAAGTARDPHDEPPE